MGCVNVGAVVRGGPAQAGPFLFLDFSDEISSFAVTLTRRLLSASFESTVLRLYSVRHTSPTANRANSARLGSQSIGW